MHETDAQGRYVCAMCHQHKPNLSLEPSRSQLVFGGFNVKLEHRCPACEKKLVERIERVLADQNQNYLAILGENR